MPAPAGHAVGGILAALAGAVSEKKKRDQEERQRSLKRQAERSRIRDSRRQQRNLRPGRPESDALLAALDAGGIEEQRAEAELQRKGSALASSKDPQSFVGRIGEGLDLEGAVREALLRQSPLTGEAAPQTFIDRLGVAAQDVSGAIGSGAGRIGSFITGGSGDFMDIPGVFRGPVDFPNEQRTAIPFLDTATDLIAAPFGVVGKIADASAGNRGRVEDKLREAQAARLNAETAAQTQETLSNFVVQSASLNSEGKEALRDATQTALEGNFGEATDLLLDMTDEVGSDGVDFTQILPFAQSGEQKETIAAAAYAQQKSAAVARSQQSLPALRKMLMYHVNNNPDLFSKLAKGNLTGTELSILNEASPVGAGEGAVRVSPQILKDFQITEIADAASAFLPDGVQIMPDSNFVKKQDAFLKKLGETEGAGGKAEATNLLLNGKEVPGRILPDGSKQVQDPNTGGFIDAPTATLAPRRGPQEPDTSKTPGFKDLAEIQGRAFDDDKQFREAKAGARGVIAAAQPSPETGLHTAAGDLALVFAFMKVLDPGSTVREGEAATARNAGGTPEQIRGFYNRSLEMVRGGRSIGFFSPAVREDFVERSKLLYSKRVETQLEREAQRTAFAERFNLRPEDTFQTQITDEDRAVLEEVSSLKKKNPLFGMSIPDLREAAKNPDTAEDAQREMERLLREGDGG